MKYTFVHLKVTDYTQILFSATLKTSSDIIVLQYNFN